MIFTLTNKFMLSVLVLSCEHIHLSKFLTSLNDMRKNISKNAKIMLYY